MEGLKKYFKKEIPSVVWKSLEMQTAFLKSKETPLNGLQISLGASQGVCKSCFSSFKKYAFTCFIFTVPFIHYLQLNTQYFENAYFKCFTDKGCNKKCLETIDIDRQI